jgi:hypothetical protein
VEKLKPGVKGLGKRILKTTDHLNHTLFEPLNGNQLEIIGYQTGLLLLE